MATVAHGRVGQIRNESDVCVHNGRTLAIALGAAASCAGVPMSTSERTGMVSQLATAKNGVAFKGIGFAFK